MNTDDIKGKAQDIGGAAQKAFGDITDNATDQAQGLAKQVAGKGQELYGQAKDSLQTASQSATEYAGQAKEGLSDVVQSASDYAGQAYDKGDQYARRGASLARREIEEYPLVAVLLAGAVGYLLAMLLHSRK